MKKCEKKSVFPSVRGKFQRRGLFGEGIVGENGFLSPRYFSGNPRKGSVLINA